MPIAVLLGAASSVWEAFGGLEPYFAVVTLVGGSLLGSTLFLGDQERHQFRFFAERGVPPGRVWLSRQAVGLVAVLALAVVSTASLWLRGTDWGPFLSPAGPWNTQRWMASVGALVVGWAALAGGLVLAYSSGQFCSMLLRNGLLAAFFGLVLSLPLCGWAVLMIGVGFNPIWSVAPLAIALLVATRLRVRDWVLERHTWRGWLCVGLAVAVPFAGVITTAVLMRVYEIPRADMGFDAEALARRPSDEERQTASLYREAIALLKPYDTHIRSYWEPPYTVSFEQGLLGERELAWLAENAKPLAMARQASNRPMRVLAALGIAGRSVPHDFSQRMTGLGTLLIVAGRRREQQGDLAGALDDYLAALRIANHQSQGWTTLFDTTEPSALGRLHAWSGQPTQTPELLRRAIEQLGQLDAQRPLPSDAIKCDHVFYRRLCSGDLAVLDEFELSDRATRWLVLTSWLMPWEMYRAQRLVDYLAHAELRLASYVETQLEPVRPMSEQERWRFVDSLYHALDDQGRLAIASDGLAIQAPDPRLDFWLSTTPIAREFDLRFESAHWLPLVERELQRRGLRVVLAAHVWHWSMGSGLTRLTSCRARSSIHFRSTPSRERRLCTIPRARLTRKYARP